MQNHTCAWPSCTIERAVLTLCKEHARQIHTEFVRQRSDYPREPDPMGKVYYLLVGDLVKIGFTTNLAKRLKTYPPHAELLAVEPGPKSLERQRHRELRNSLRQSNEWFVRSDEVEVQIAAVLAEHGAPKVFRRQTMRKPANRAHFPITVTRIDA